jgi:O-antigen/teichoic acid export membrane protein
MGVWVSLQVILSYTKYSNLGLTNAAAREIPYERGRQHFERIRILRDSSYSFTLIMAFVLSLAMIAGAFMFRAKFGKIFFYSLLTLSALSFFQRASTFCITLLRADKQFDFINRFNVVSALVNAVLTVVLIGGLGLYGYYLSMILSFVFNYYYVLNFSSISFKFGWDWKEIRPLFVMGLGLIASSVLFTFFCSVDKILISTLLGFKALGLYSLAIMAGSIITAFPNNLGIIVFPYLNEAQGTAAESDKVKKLVIYPTLFIAVYMPVLIASIWIIGPRLVYIFLPKYIDGIRAMQISLFATLFMILSNNMSDALITFKKYLWMLPIQAGLGILLFSVCVWRISQGAGITAVAGWMTAGYSLLYVIYGAIALRQICGPKDAVMQIFKVIVCISYSLGLMLTLERIWLGYSTGVLVRRLVMAVIGFVPLILFGERQFGTGARIAAVIQRIPVVGRFAFYRNIRRYWENRGGERYFNEQESREDRTETSRFLAREISRLQGDSILEVGCGYGKVLKSLREFTAVPLTGIDFSFAQLQKAKEYLRGLDGIALLEGDAQRLPFPDDSFDIVFTSNVILHNPPEKADKIRREIIRVAKKYVVHKEDTDVNFSRYGYNHAQIYRKMGLKVLRAERIDCAADADITQFTVVQKN